MIEHAFYKHPLSIQLYGLFLVAYEPGITLGLCCIYSSAYAIIFYKFNLTKLRCSQIEYPYHRAINSQQASRYLDILDCKINPCFVGYYAAAIDSSSLRLYRRHHDWSFMLRCRCHTRNVPSALLDASHVFADSRCLLSGESHAYIPCPVCKDPKRINYCASVLYMLSNNSFFCIKKYYIMRLSAEGWSSLISW